MKIVHLLFLFLLVISFSTAEGQTWTSLSSPTGYKNIRAMTIDATGDTIYATDSLSVLKSNDNGQTWEATSSTIAGATAITSKYGRSNIVIVSGPSFFKRSVDGGSNWSNLTSTTNKPTALARFRGEPHSMIMGRKYGSLSERALGVSRDSGATWSDKLSNTHKPRIFDIAINPGTSAPSYAVAAGGPDGAVATGRGLFYTNGDYGNTWAYKANGSSDPSWTAVALQYHAVGTENIVYAGTAAGKLYKCRWKDSFASMDSLEGFPPHTFADTVRAIRISPSDSLTVYVATDRSVYKTTNGGSSWASIYTGMTDSRAYSMEVNPANSAKLIVGSRGYIYRSTDSGSNWTSISDSTTRNLPHYSLVTADSNLWAASNELTIGTKYNGSTWSTQRLGHKDSSFLARHSYSYLNESETRYIFHSGVQDDRSRVYRSTDGGATFLLQNDFNTDTLGTVCEGITQDPSNLAYAYAYGDLDNATPKNFFSSSTYGDSWTKTHGYAATERWLIMAPLGDGLGDQGSSKFIYVGTNGSGLIRAQNLGSWPNISTGTIPSGKKVYAFTGNPRKVNTAYTGTQDGLYFSSNADNQADNLVAFSQTWSTSGVKKVLLDPRFTDPTYSSRAVFWVGVNNVIYRSADTGSSAQSVFGNLPSGVVINDLRGSASDSTVIFIATDKGIFEAQLQTSPTLTSPTNGADSILYCITSTENLIFTWSAVPGATSYDIQIDDASDFSSPIESSPSTNQYSHSSNLSELTTYYWRVRSSDGTNLGKSPYSPSSSFTTATNDDVLDAPSLISPSNGATGVPTNPLLSWNAVEGAIKYRVSVGGVFTVITSSTSYQVSGLSAYSHYYWNVTALNCASNPTSTRDFITGCCDENDLGGGGDDSSRTLHRNTDESSLVREFQVSQNYPNPFNPTTRFDYALPYDAYVRLRIFNTLGQVVATVVDEIQTTGWKSVEYDAGPLPSGLYFYRLDAGQFSAIKKMLLIK